MSGDGEDGAKQFLASFADAKAVEHYAQGPRRYVPGLDALHRMMTILLAERAPADARVLVLGAGGGLELDAMARAHAGWRFVGVDPAAAMLDLAARTLGPLADRADLVTGYIDDAPHGPFDAATCLLTLHFLDPAERLRTVREVHRRLKLGAPFVAAHGSFPQGKGEEAGEGERDLWLSRYAAYALASGADPEQVAGAKKAVASSVQMLEPDHDLAILREGGFTDVVPFYAAFTWRGWVGYA